MRDIAVSNLVELNWFGCSRCKHSGVDCHYDVATIEKNLRIEFLSPDCSKAIIRCTLFEECEKE